MRWPGETGRKAIRVGTLVLLFYLVSVAALLVVHFFT